MEGVPRRDLAEVYPDGVREVEALGAQVDDDDLAQMLIVAEESARGELNAERLLRRFWQWAETNGAGIGRQTRAVLAMYGGARPRCPGWRRTKWEPRRPAGVTMRQIADSPAAQGCGNGALMRCSPVAIRWRDDPAQLVRNSVVSAMPTHPSPRCGWSCAVANLAAAALLNDEPIDPAALVADCEAAAAWSAAEMERKYDWISGAPSSVRLAVQAAVDMPVSAMTTDDRDRGYTLLTLQVALSAVLRSADFETGLSEVISAGGDTDTNGAVAGALLGAKFGIDAIPEAWRREVAKIREGRPPVEDHAARLLQGVAA